MLGAERALAELVDCAFKRSPMIDARQFPRLRRAVLFRHEPLSRIGEVAPELDSVIRIGAKEMEILICAVERVGYSRRLIAHFSPSTRDMSGLSRLATDFLLDSRQLQELGG